MEITKLCFQNKNKYICDEIAKLMRKWWQNELVSQNQFHRRYEYNL